MKKIKLKNCVSSGMLAHMRDDADLLEKTELKRQRKLMKAKQNIKKLKE